MKDWEEKHSKLCKEGGEEWKRKRGADARVETGLKELEDGFEKAMNSAVCFKHPVEAIMVPMMFYMTNINV